MTMDEYIPREAVIDRLCEYLNFGSEYGAGVSTRGMFRLILSTVPAVDVVPVVHGKWEWNPDGTDWGIGAWVCSVCNSKPETWWAAVHKLNPLCCSGSKYCSNCGAKMDGDGDV